MIKIGCNNTYLMQQLVTVDGGIGYLPQQHWQWKMLYKSTRSGNNKFHRRMKPQEFAGNIVRAMLSSYRHMSNIKLAILDFIAHHQLIKHQQRTILYK